MARDLLAKSEIWTRASINLNTRYSLHIDKDAGTSPAFFNFLEEFSYTVLTAKDGKEGLEKFSKDINLAILDIQMPYMNGLELLKEIRKESQLPVLMLTAFNEEEYKIDAFTNLADGYIEKPFSLPLLKAREDSLIKKNFPNQETFSYKDLEVC